MSWTSSLLEELREAQRRDARRKGLEAHHTPAAMVLGLITNVGELSDIFQWKDAAGGRSVRSWNSRDKRLLQETMADTLLSLIRLSDLCDTDLGAFARKRSKRIVHEYPPTHVQPALPSLDNSLNTQSNPMQTQQHYQYAPVLPQRANHAEKPPEVYCPIFPEKKEAGRVENVVCPLLPEHASRGGGVVHQTNGHHVHKERSGRREAKEAHSVLRCASNSGSSSATHSTVWSIAPSPPMSPLRGAAAEGNMPPANAQPAPAAAQRRPRLRRTLTVSLPKTTWEQEKEIEVYSPTHFKKDLFSPCAAESELTFDDSMVPRAITAVQKNKAKEGGKRRDDMESSRHSSPARHGAGSPSSTTSMSRLPGRTNSAFTNRVPPDQAKDEEDEKNNATMPVITHTTAGATQAGQGGQTTARQTANGKGGMKVPQSPARSDASGNSALSDFNCNIIAGLESNEWSEVCWCFLKI